MKKLIVVVLILLVILGVWIYFTKNSPQISEEEYSGWLVATSTENGISFRYPDNLGTTYISIVDWPPMINIYDEKFSCTESGKITERAGQTVKKVINGTTYCITQINEGAAGSTYRQYAYVFEQDGKTAAMNFSLRFPQCANYEEVQMNQCNLEQQNLDVNGVVDKIVKSIKK